MMKIKLLTNVSHEFRTPVSLILAPLEELLRHIRETDHQQKLQLVRANAKRLLNLVNQLMDFRKMEMKELKPDLSRGDVAVFVKEVVLSFNDLAERKQVSLSYQSDCEHLHTYFDHDKLERILFNLLSNAFKFTPQDGAITVNVQVTESEGKAWMEIKVEDTGIGIPKERQDKIFERFFQSDVHTALVSQGSGIGLAITKEFVKLANGTMTVESEENKGSCFTVRLPFELSEAPPDVEHATFDTPREVILPAAPIVSDKTERKEQTILLVEDNDDFRFYLKENLKAFYEIIEAPDGKAGWQKALSAHPDLVVSDINMPQMDGMELCRKIKNDNRTKYIPVILLTAMAGEQEQLQGLEAGAVDYMVKPFNFEIMLSRVRNILNRQAPVKLVVGQSAVGSGQSVVSADEKFLQRALEIVEKQLSNADFSVEELSRELCMNRVSVYRRIFSITGQTPVEFIRTVRLRRAAQLLAQTEMNVTEVAYEVGFNNPKYFAKYFKIAYKMLPSAYASAMRRV
jgi:DNA-binding response OmpR family regulator